MNIVRVLQIILTARFRDEVNGRNGDAPAIVCNSSRVIPSPFSRRLKITSYRADSKPSIWAQTQTGMQHFRKAFLLTRLLSFQYSPELNGRSHVP
jgi:hypothetical protein